MEDEPIVHDVIAAGAARREMGDETTVHDAIDRIAGPRGAVFGACAGTAVGTAVGAAVGGPLGGVVGGVVGYVFGRGCVVVDRRED